MPKISIIGLDGVNWRIIDKAIEKGKMPNLQELRKKGTTAELETTYPSVTGPAWTSIATGDNPGKHGVFDFVNHVEDGRPYNSTDIATETIYEKISDEGGKVTVVNLPLSYPPKYEGEFVGSFLSPEDDYVRPESLKQRYDFSEYRKSLSAFEKVKSSDAVIEASAEVVDSKIDLMDEIMDDQDFFYLMFSAPDWIMHKVYHRMKDGDPEAAFELLGEIDDAIGTAKERSDNLILLSDHGFNDFKKVFHVNQWLREEGYLEVEGSMGSQWSDNRVIDAGLKAFTGNRMTRRLARNLYLKFEDFLPLTENVKVRLSAAFSEGIDRENSVAFTPTSGIRGVYINDERFEGSAENPDELRNELIEKLPDKVNPKHREEVYSGEFLNQAPDIVFREEDYRLSRGIYGKVCSDRKVNHHGVYGFFIAEGMDFSQENLEKISLYDIAPTVAELFDLEFDADGNILPIISRKRDIRRENLPGDF